MRPRFELYIKVNSKLQEDVVYSILDKLGYREYNNERDVRWKYIKTVKSATGMFTGVSNPSPSSKEIVLEDWNEPLLQALLSATEGDDFIVGEYAYSTHHSMDYEKGKLYKISIREGDYIKSEDSFPEKNAQKGIIWFRKHTIEELKQHFLNMKEDRELIGYKLLKSFPGVPAGSLFTWGGVYYSWKNEEDHFVYSKKDIDNSPGWFEPVYKEVIKEVVRTIKPEVGEYITLKIKKDGITAIPRDSPEQIWDKEDIEEFKRLLLSAVFKGWDIISNTVNIGCRKGIKVSDLQECIDIYDKMQK